MIFTTPLQRRDIWAALGAVLLAIAAYAMSVGFEFVYDDLRIFAGHPEFQSLANWREIVTTSWWPTALYRPFTQLSLAVDWAVSGGDPAYFHAMNVLIHAGVTLAVFLLARAWFATLGALIAGLLFAAHPVHVEAVANVVGRAEMFAALFAVTAALLYWWDGALARRGDQSWRRVTASFGTLGLLLLGLGSKESAFAIPGMLLIVDWLAAKQSAEPFPDRVRRHAVLWFASVALGMAWLMMRSEILGDYAGDRAGPGLYGEDFLGRVWVMAPVILQYLRLFVFPLHLSADYSPNYLPAVPSATLLGLAGLAVLGVGLVVAAAARRGAPVITFALAWIGGTLLVVSNLIVPSGVLLAERSMYLPSVGVVLVGAWLAERSARRWSVRATAVVAGVVVALASVRTVTRQPVWRDADTFFPNLVMDAPGSYRSMWVAAMVWYSNGDRERGESLLRGALAMVPTFPNTWQDFGRRLQEENRMLEAAQAFHAAFRLDEERRLYDAASAVTNFVRAGMLDSAWAIMDRARAIDPHHPRLLLAMGDIAASQSEFMEAMTWRRQAAWRDPSVVNYWFLTADAALHASFCPEATRSIARVRELQPDFEHLGQLEDRARANGCE